MGCKIILLVPTVFWCCCCCFSSKRGARLIGIFQAIVGIFLFIAGINLIIFNPIEDIFVYYPEPYNWKSWIVPITGGVLVLFAIFLLIGIQKDRLDLIEHWFLAQLLFTIFVIVFDGFQVLVDDEAEGVEILILHLVFCTVLNICCLLAIGSYCSARVYSDGESDKDIDEFVWDKR